MLRSMLEHETVTKSTAIFAGVILKDFELNINTTHLQAIPQDQFQLQDSLILKSEFALEIEEQGKNIHEAVIHEKQWVSVLKSEFTLQIEEQGQNTDEAAIHKEQWVCQNCNACHGTSEDLKRHRCKCPVSEKLPVYRCEICTKVFFNKKSVRRHKRTVHETWVGLCENCDAHHGTRNDLKRHQHECYGSEKLYWCAFCTKAFCDQKSLTKHIHDVHTAAAKPWLCHVCGKTYVKGHEFKRHFYCHSEEPPLKHVCEICNKGFWGSNRLKLHLRIHTKEKPFPCNVCGKSFTRLDNLKIHTRKHTDETPYSCQPCNKKFKYHCEIISHRRIYHTLEKPFKCEFCGKAMSQQNAMKIHLRTHTKEKHYICDVCGKKIGSLANLNVHRCMHTKENAHACESCGEKFGSPDSLKTHLCARAEEELQNYF